jgi:cation:H+ antiporter
MLPAAAILFGLILLVWSADRFVFGAAATARKLGMSPLLIGMTIVSIGTSAPEIFVSATAALEGAGALAIGNAIGSNIANIGLVLGVTALVSPIPIPKALIKRELPILLLVTVIAGYVLYDLTIDLIDSLVLLACLGITLYLLFVERGEHPVEAIDTEEQRALEQAPLSKALGWLTLGLILLLISSKLLVWGSVAVATYFGVSELVTGLTIVAIGTSLPELAASVASALKGHHEIAIGNVIGSNIFNLLAVLPIPGLVMATSVEPSAFSRDYISMLGLTVFLGLCLLVLTKASRLGRLPGALMLVSYGCYMGWLFIETSGSL